ncbi:MAG: pyrroline-5-carboxylate reductase [Pseudomonadota bacterium]
MGDKAQVVLVGCGNMGFAMLAGWLEQSVLRPQTVWVVEPTGALRQRAQSLGVQAVSSANDLPPELQTEIIIFAVKPQVLGDVLRDYLDMAARSNPTIVSVAAGIGIARFSEAFGESAAIVRVMPNTPSAIGQGMMVVCPNAATDKPRLAHVEALMAASGKVATIHDETLMDAVTAVSGSGPAYVFHMVEAMRDAGVSAGLPQDIAHTLALQTVVGAANYASVADDDVAELRKQVTSPNGTTAAALDVLMDDSTGMRPLIRRAVEAARDRSKELGS